MKNKKPVTIKPDIGPVVPVKTLYGDDDISMMDLLPSADYILIIVAAPTHSSTLILKHYSDYL